jgi:hexokinase
MCVESVIENDIAQGLTQKGIAETYAMGMVSSWPTDWARVNQAIIKRWPKGLNRVKKMAHKIMHERMKGKA